MLRLGSWQERAAPESAGPQQRSSMPYRYAGDKLSGQKFEKLLQLLVGATAFEHEGAASAEWPQFRAIITTIAEDKLQSKAAERVAADATEQHISSDWDPRPSTKQLKVLTR